jgi:hypothetical protein
MNKTQNEQKKAFKWWWGWNPGKIEKGLEEEEMVRNGHEMMGRMK